MIGDLLRPPSVEALDACISAKPTMIQAGRGTNDESDAAILSVASNRIKNVDIFLNYLRKSTEFQQRDVSELFIDCLKEIAKKPNQSQSP